MIPHVTDMICERIETVGEESGADIVLVEVGGTVGDIENELYLEAIRQLRSEKGRSNVVFVHLTYVPIPTGVNEQKTKPTQQSVSLLQERGIQPEFILGRCEEPLTDSVVEKIHTFTGVPTERVVSAIDVASVYDVPFTLHRQRVHEELATLLSVETPQCRRLQEWKAILDDEPSDTKTVLIAGKYTDLEDSYASVVESIHHAAHAHNVDIEIVWGETSEGNVELDGVDGVIVPGGFGTRGIEGKIDIIREAREKNVPFLGLCYGLQLAVVEYARHVCGLDNAHTTEVDEETPYPVVTILDEQQGIEELGGTMRLGSCPDRKSVV